MKKNLLFLALILWGLFSATSVVAQVTAFQPDDLEVCDDDNDGFAAFDLMYTIPQILNGQPGGDFYVTFYETLSDATNAVNFISYSYAYNYTNVSNPQTIYVRLQSEATGDFDTTNFDLIVHNSPTTIPTPTPLEYCDNDNDGFGEFTLTDADEEITGGNPNITVTYHWVFGDAFGGYSALQSPYFNDVPFTQSLYVRVFNQDIDCFTIITIWLIVNNTPTPIIPTPLEACDENNEGFAEFMLTDKDLEIIGGEPDVTITYHQTLLEAELGILYLNSPYVNIITPVQIIFARVTNDVTGCFKIVELQLIVNNTPEINPVTDLVVVDDDGDGFTTFDLSSKIPEILNGQTDINITFYVTQADAETGVNAIVNPTAFTNTSNPQTIYTRLENFESCFAITNFDLVAVDAIIDTEPDDLYINEGDDDGFAIFDLTINEAQMLGDQDPLIALFTYHITLEDATNGENSIATPNAYQNIINPQTIFVRLTNSNTGYYVLTDFEIETDGALGISDNFYENLKLYPNPTSGIINIQSDQLTEIVALKVYNLQGQAVLLDHSVPSNGTISLDLSSLNTGVYFIKIDSEEGTIVKKIVKL